MARRIKTENRAADQTVRPLGYEAQLWKTADALRNNMDAAEHKHVVLGPIFLKYISDAFEAKHAELAAQIGEGADPEDQDEYPPGSSGCRTRPAGRTARRTLPTLPSAQG